jgi:putative endonuclease
VPFWNRTLGNRGEQLAAEHLKKQGARVLARNARSSSGELDLVVEHQGDIVAVEVKTRVEGQPALPEEAVGYVKLQRLKRLITEFAVANGYEDRPWRIDVVAVEVDARGKVQRLDHVRDAYG